MSRRNKMNRSLNVRDYKKGLKMLGCKFEDTAEKKFASETSHHRYRSDCLGHISRPTLATMLSQCL